jgi:regulator of RNase E activity RraA
MAVKMNLEQLEKQRSFDPHSPLPVAEDELCGRFRVLYTGAVNDVMREFLLVDQTLPYDLVPLIDGKKFAGPAFTIKSAKDPSINPEREMEYRAKMLTEVPKGAVCVWDTNRDNLASHLGGMMTASLLKNGAVGAVVDGGIRDVHQILEKEFPVFYRYRTPNAMLSRVGIIGYQTPVWIGTVIVYPGDIIFADLDGVIVVPRTRAYEILLRAEELVGFEKNIEKWIDRGESATEIVAKGGYF